MINKLKKLFKKYPADPDVPRLSDCWESMNLNPPYIYLYCLKCKKVFLNDLAYIASANCPYCHLTLCHAESRDAAMEAVWTDKLTETDFWDDETCNPLDNIKKVMRRIREETGW